MAGIKLKLKWKKPPQRTRRINIDRLKNENVRNRYHDALEAGMLVHLEKTGLNVNEEWNILRDIIHATSEKELGYRAEFRKREWLSEHTLKLMDERRTFKAKRKISTDLAKHHNYLCRMVKISAKNGREQDIKDVCNGVEEARVQNKSRAIYEGVRKITGEHAPQLRSVKDEAGNILTGAEEVKARWGDYFNKLYNDPNAVDKDILKNLPEASDIEDIPDLDEDEVKAAVLRMKKGK